MLAQLVGVGGFAYIAALYFFAHGPKLISI
jgi:hypothetical protein